MLALVGPSQEGGGLCRPVSAPARVSQARTGRERPPLRLALAAPGPPGGAAHAPDVGVGDVLGRAAGAGEIAARGRLRFPGNPPSVMAHSRVIGNYRSDSISHDR